MKANELRIGNLVQYGVNIVPIKSIHIESVLKNEVRVYVELNKMLSNYILDIDEIEPIQLTEEWLIKFGFIEVDYAGGCYIKEDVKIDMNDFNCCYKRDWLEIDVKYVHKLQNLYYALTDVELELSSNVA